MRKPARFAAAVAIAATLTTGIAGCSNLPDIDPSRLPDISVPSRTTDAPDPVPTETVTETAESDTAETETTEPDTAETSAPAPIESPAPAEDADEGADTDDQTEWWPWALAALAVLLLIVWWARASARRRAWDKRFTAARSELAWFEDSLVAQVLAQPSAADANAHWQAAKPSILETDRALYDLSQAGPTQTRKATASRGVHALRAMSAAVDEDVSLQPDRDADALRSARALVDTARKQVRTFLAETAK